MKAVLKFNGTFWKTSDEDIQSLSIAEIFALRVGEGVDFHAD